MDLSLFDYSYPKELVAQRPLEKRDDSRLMVLDRSNKTWSHQVFGDITTYFKEGDLLVLNDAEADLIPFGETLVPPLPPYIKRKKLCDFTDEDFERYRTIYAKSPGSKAAPTAGFHFTKEILDTLRKKGVLIQTVTLHVSHDTYKPIRSENILDHPMHGEEYQIPQETAAAIQKAKSEGRRVIAVGTTTTRALESWAIDVRAGLKPAPTTTSLFITPGYRFKIIDALLTNFHRPHSTVLVLVSSFAGREFILSAYQEAVAQRYRLFSYGDCMLIL
ncbi:MAG: S-adenosylmethionine:tRNA ribosyltransferase-isomerase [Deltaproteobacteria bacterium]|nr:S-adenosylmethionine:tRNA ribosyltransferase-isomerase [Deltaproteobacteria bacterium]